MHVKKLTSFCEALKMHIKENWFLFLCLTVCYQAAGDRESRLDRGVYSNWLTRGQHRAGAESDIYECCAPVRASGRNAPLIRFLISALYTGWLKIKCPTEEYAISPQPVV